ncbi:MAG: PaaI family thioesterase [Spirochaetota bacterium]|nr:PaaI family thioesterase [Spirochaetota bacterium]
MSNNLNAIQDYYSDFYSHCYGCGRLNEHGYKIKTFWDGDNTICHFTPKEYYTSVPGYAYGGLIASLIDCHGIGSAAAAIYRAENRSLDSTPAIRCLTASLKVDYLKPTPINKTLELKGFIQEVKNRKVIVTVELRVDNILYAKGEVIAVRIPDDYKFDKS